LATAPSGITFVRPSPHARGSRGKGSVVMVKVGLFARLQAKPGKEAEVAKLLESALALAREER